MPWLDIFAWMIVIGALSVVAAIAYHVTKNYDESDVATGFLSVIGGLVLVAGSILAGLGYVDRNTEYGPFYRTVTSVSIKLDIADPPVYTVIYQSPESKGGSYFRCEDHPAIDCTTLRPGDVIVVMEKFGDLGHLTASTEVVEIIPKQK